MTTSNGLTPACGPVVTGSECADRGRAGADATTVSTRSRQSGVAVVFYVLLGLAAVALAWWLVRSPVLRALLRGHATDPAQFGSWQDHLDDIGLGP